MVRPGHPISPASKQWSWVLMVCLLSLGAGPSAHGQGMAVPGDETAGVFAQSSGLGSAEDQLRQLKQSLLAFAMERKARVAASGWTDRSGAMSEDVMVFSDIAVARLQPVMRPSRYGSAKIQWALRGYPPQPVCVDQDIRRQRLGLVVNRGPSANPSDHNLAKAAADRVVGYLQQALERGALSQAASLTGGSVKSAPTASAYHRYMTAAPVVEEDLRLQVTIAAAQDNTPLGRVMRIGSVRPSKRVSVELTLVAQDNTVGSWQQDFVVASNSQATGDQRAWLELTDASEAALQNWLQQITNDINGAIGCYGETAVTIVDSGGQATLSGGRDIGIYPGQRLAILPTDKRFRNRGLESSLGVMGLAQVVRVGPRSATVSIIAGPAEGDFADMMAVPVAMVSRLQP